MDFVTSVRTCLLEKYASFNGRASRPEFWWFALFCLIVNLVGGMILNSLLNALVSLALFVPSIAVGARRLHDIGKTGWLQLLWIIPIVGWVILIYWAAQPGQTGGNAYGGAPTDAPSPPEMAPGPQ